MARSASADQAPVTETGTRPDYKHIIESKARNEIGAYWDTRERSRAFASLKKLTAQAAREYENRSLIELVQNAYDAHPAGSQGTIHIRLDLAQGPHGTLYVANAGRPFTHSNFRAICEIGLSDKPPGEGIGNKGVGFKSAIQICHWPEIYSAAEADDPNDQFRGFCFTFARPEDIGRLTDGNAEKCAAVINDVSPYSLPVPLENRPDEVMAFAEEGLATVVRLQLKNARALAAIKEQIEGLTSTDVPILLFLDRIQTLVIETGIGDDTIERVELARSDHQVGGGADGRSQFQIANLGHQGEFLICRRTIGASQLQVSIRESIDAELLDESWSEWTDDAHVATAVRLDAEEKDHRMYTFLPMGQEAQSPFSGHLNAPFLTKLARLSIEEDVPLNSMLLDEAARCCAEMILFLREGKHSISRTAVLDLLSWKETHYQRLVSAFDELGVEIKKADLIPIVPLLTGAEWGSLDSVHRWDFEDLGCLTTDMLVGAANVQLLPQAMGEGRSNAFHRFCSNCFGSGIDASAETIADWAEEVASYLHGQAFSPTQWDAFYDDLAVLLAAKGKVLQGRRILLDDEGELRACGVREDDTKTRPQVTMFFQPMRDRSEDDEEVDAGVDLKIPSSLRKYLSFMHPDLTWYTRSGNTQRRKASRHFFQDARLVQPYRTRDLLEHVGNLLARTHSQERWRDALKWTYNVHKARPETDGPALDELHLHVPTETGWAPAAEAFFSADWPGTNGPTLGKLIAETRGVSAELRDLGERLLVSPTQWPFPLEEAELPKWSEFLTRAGVKDVLWPSLNSDKTTDFVGRDVTPSRVLAVLNLQFPEAVGEGWVRAAKDVNDYPMYPLTNYRVPNEAWHLPGQGDYASFSDRARRLYANLLIVGLDRWTDDHLEFVIKRPRPRDQDPCRWPSLVSSFLRKTDWLPMARAGDREVVDFVPAVDAWHFSDATGDPAPAFAALLPRDVRRLIDESPTARKRLRDAGMKVWNEASDSRELIVEMGRIFASESITDFHVSSFKKNYARAWADVVSEELDSPFEGAPNDAVIVVTRSGRLATMLLKLDHDASAAIYVNDEEKGLTSRLLESLGESILDVGHSQGAQVAELLQEVLEGHVRRVSHVDVEVQVDGAPFEPDADDPLLIVGDTQWLVTLVALTFELRGTRFLRRTERLQRQILSRLRRIRTRVASKVLILVDGHEAPIPPQMRAALPVKDERSPTLVLSRSDWLEWNGLEQMASGLAELLDQPQMGSDLKLALMELERLSGPGPLKPPTNQHLATVFDESPDFIAEINRGLRGEIQLILDFLCPLVVHYIGEAAAEPFRDADPSLVSEDTIMTALREHAVNLPRSPRDIVLLCREVTSLDDLRDELQIAYGDFNGALRVLGPPYEPIHNREGHEQALSFFKQTHREEILAALRKSFLSAFRADESLLDYVNLRDLATMRPMEEWLDLVDLPDDVMMQSLTNDWLSSLGAPALAETHELEPLDNVRQANDKLVRDIANRAVKLVPAWCNKNGSSIPPHWSDSESAWERTLREASEVGILDFERLTELKILMWFARQGWWPEAMPLGINLALLGLTPEEVRAQESAAEREKRDRELERTSIRIGGQRYSADPADYRTLIDAVRNSCSEEFLASSTRFASLTRMEERRARDSGYPGSRITSSRREASPLQTKAIGLVGEVLAYEWLRKRFGDIVTPDCWKSIYRNYALGGLNGDDSLGYDFEVVMKSQTLYFEVKATSTDRMQIELGQSEVEIAQKNSRNRQYRILFIPEALDETARHVHVLPNPFTEAGREFYRLTGSGLKYEFQLALLKVG
jgi:hypothetical protein